jgi:hypothetical protein
VSKINRRVDQDAAEIMELITRNLHGKYIAPFEEAIRNRSEILSQNPPPEIGLLSALRPFVDDKCCAVIDKLVSSYSLATLAKVMAEDLMHARGNSPAAALTAGRPNPDTISRMQFPSLSILLPLIILLIISETH